jgi:hypothetical protein
MVMNEELLFNKEQAKMIQDFSLKDMEFRKNLKLIVTAWQLQKIATTNAINLIKEELEKAEKRNQ